MVSGTTSSSSLVDYRLVIIIMFFSGGGRDSWSLVRRGSQPHWRNRQKSYALHSRSAANYVSVPTYAFQWQFSASTQCALPTSSQFPSPHRNHSGHRPTFLFLLILRPWEWSTRAKIIIIIIIITHLLSTTSTNDLKRSRYCLWSSELCLSFTFQPFLSVSAPVHMAQQWPRMYDLWPYRLLDFLRSSLSLYLSSSNAL